MFLLDVTSDGRFKFAGFNPAEEKAVGLSSAEVSGRFVKDVFAADLARKITANYRRCLEAGALIEYDDELNLPGGRRHFHSNLIPMRNPAGRIHRIVGVCIDVTDWKQAESAMRRSLDEIAHLNRVAAMGELAASLAHELNQPLAAILLNSQAASRFLNGQPPNLTRVRNCLNAIAADDERAGEVIQRLRGLLKKGESQASLVDVNEVVSDALRLVGNDASLRRVSVKFEPLPGSPDRAWRPDTTLPGSAEPDREWSRCGGGAAAGRPLGVGADRRGGWRRCRIDGGGLWKRDCRKR